MPRPMLHRSRRSVGMTPLASASGSPRRSRLRIASRQKRSGNRPAGPVLRRTIRSVTVTCNWSSPAGTAETRKVERTAPEQSRRTASVCTRCAAKSLSGARIFSTKRGISEVRPRIRPALRWVLTTSFEPGSGEPAHQSAARRSESITPLLIATAALASAECTFLLHRPDRRLKQ